MEEKRHFIKVNLPVDREGYVSGYGEGVWVIIDDETNKSYEANETGGVFEGILDNDSIYYVGLEHGTKIPFETRGESRPVADLDWLQKNYAIRR